MRAFPCPLTDSNSRSLHHLLPPTQPPLPAKSPPSSALNLGSATYTLAFATNVVSGKEARFCWSHGQCRRLALALWVRRTSRGLGLRNLDFLDFMGEWVREGQVRRSKIEVVTRDDGRGWKKQKKGSGRVQILVLIVVPSGIDCAS
jgi:hypothetical protein